MTGWLENEGRNDEDAKEPGHVVAGHLADLIRHFDGTLSQHQLRPQRRHSGGPGNRYGSAALPPAIDGLFDWRPIMSVLSDVYLFDPSDALVYDDDPQAMASERAEFKSLTHLHFAQLWAILRGDSQEVSVDLADQFRCLFTSSSENRFIHQFPKEFVTLLTESDDDTIIEQAAQQWAATEELECQPDEARSIIEDLIHLAWLSESSKKSMYLWVCA
jgi:hypothetical protein